jgi:hypothetical protein
MSKVQKIEAELEKLSRAEMLQVRDWLDDFLEDQMQFTDEFEAKIQLAERDMAAGNASRTRQGARR